MARWIKLPVVSHHTDTKQNLSIFWMYTRTFGRKRTSLYAFISCCSCNELYCCK